MVLEETSVFFPKAHGEKEFGCLLVSILKCAGLLVKQ